jgi:prepilin-type N-terminal cleavage/methylation domain-containing protein
MIRRHFSKLGMTLIELMVAMALGVVLIGIMVSVWTTSQKIMSRTTDNIAIFQNLRTVLDTIEKDVSNVVRTTDMEFFDDKNGNSHYDLIPTIADAEEIPSLRDNELFYIDTDSTGAGSPDPALPDGLGRDLNAVPYFFAATLVRHSNYPKVVGWDNDEDVSSNNGHRRDEFYFRTFSLIGGESRPVMVHYRLRIPEQNPQRPTLLRTITFIDRSTDTPIASPPRVDELADGVTDLEFAMFYKESRIHDRGQYLDAKQLRQVDSVTNKAAVPGLEQQFNATACSLVYSGDAFIENTRENGIWLRPADEKIQFGAVRPGDRFYLYDAEDDDGTANNTALAADFGRKFLTVEQIIALQPSGGTLGDTVSKIFIKFVEPIDFSVLGTGLGGEPTETVTEFGESDKKRTIYQQFKVKFRVGFLPGAFRVQFKYRDFRARRLKPFTRVIRVLGS